MKRTFLFLSLLPLLTSCSSDYDKEELKAENREDRVYRGLGKLMGDETFTFGGPKKKEDEETGLGVNSFLWRASLDTISFMPLVSADPFGGVIITDWYSPTATPDERFKMTIYILDRQLRSDGLRVSIFKQTRDKSAHWVDQAVDKKTTQDLENGILVRARQLRSRTGK
ncbi:DUF3576 domain-containing protein [Candidatus Bealeia paramacronuclearis]|uniref:DUF3576 domain-containing protein n=1 Tax=Candidatus Bealeia paramacronuclearis TaxID=1921001 RepID=A0ABZ2C2N7_9PROT|nr:hypothetical protein [Candidatus Bealeia paramacronuclearis]